MTCVWERSRRPGDITSIQRLSTRTYLVVFDAVEIVKLLSRAFILPYHFLLVRATISWLRVITWIRQGRSSNHLYCPSFSPTIFAEIQFRKQIRETNRFFLFTLIANVRDVETLSNYGSRIKFSTLSVNPNFFYYCSVHVCFVTISRHSDHLVHYAK